VRLRPLSEAECYARCHGGGDDSVRVLPAEPRRRPPRLSTHLSGEELRRLFEARLNSRETQAA